MDTELDCVDFCVIILKPYGYFEALFYHVSCLIDQPISPCLPVIVSLSTVRFIGGITWPYHSEKIVRPQFQRPDKLSIITTHKQTNTVIANEELRVLRFVYIL